MAPTSTHYTKLYPQNGDRVVTIESVTSLHPIYCDWELVYRTSRWQQISTICLDYGVWPSVHSAAFDWWKFEPTKPVRSDRSSCLFIDASCIVQGGSKSDRYFKGLISPNVKYSVILLTYSLKINRLLFWHTLYVVVVVLVVVTFFNHNFVNCKVTLILAIKNLRNKHRNNETDKRTNVASVCVTVRWTSVCPVDP